MKKEFAVYASDKAGAAVFNPIQSGDHVGLIGERCDLKAVTAE